MQTLFPTLLAQQILTEPESLREQVPWIWIVVGLIAVVLLALAFVAWRRRPPPPPQPWR